MYVCSSVLLAFEFMEIWKQLKPFLFIAPDSPIFNV